MRLRSRNVGSTLEAMGYYPLNRETTPRVRTSVRLTAEQQADAELVAEFWNALDKELRQERTGRAWTATSVLERLIAVGLDGFWGEVGGRPTNEGERGEVLRRAVAQLRSKQKK